MFCLFQGRLKTGKPFDDRRPFNQAAVCVSKPAETVLNAGKAMVVFWPVAEAKSLP